MDGPARSPHLGVVPDPAPSASSQPGDQLAPAAHALAHPLVVVTWHDAWFDLELDHLEDAGEHYLVRTVGYLIRSGSVVSLAQEVLPDGDGYRAVTHIPAAMVRSVEPVGTSGG